MAARIRVTLGGLGVRTGEIARILGVTSSAVSQHRGKARADGPSGDLEKMQLLE
ncbi:MAG: hypothetical protein L0216_09675 [Planctomycetales bacterium]|nr:hypothetical protein [Planctomycetales bacterium]